MRTIQHGNIKRFLVAASVALAVPLTAVAFQGHPGGHHGCGGFAKQTVSRRSYLDGGLVIFMGLPSRARPAQAVRAAPG